MEDPRGPRVLEELPGGKARDVTHEVSHVTFYFKDGKFALSKVVALEDSVKRSG